MINSFSQENRFLHNSAEKIGNNEKPIAFIEYEGIEYTNVTSAFFASQIRDKGLRNAFAPLSATEAEEKFDEWKAVVPSFLEPSFEADKKDILFLLLFQKFSDEYFLEKLLATNDEELVFENSYGDTFLGVCEGEGENYLGTALMEIRSKKRDELKKKESYVYSIGYGNLGMQDFLNILKDCGIEVVVDIRRNTISHNKLFGAELLGKSLNENNIKYAWSGDWFSEVEPGDQAIFDEDGYVIYEELWNEKKNKKLKAFCERAIHNKKRICFLSPEFNPEHSHRGRLIGNKAFSMGIDICHIIFSREGVKLSFQSELDCPSDFSYKSYWGYTPKAISLMQFLDRITTRYLYHDDAFIHQKLSESKKTAGMLIELVNSLDNNY